ncbi:MAG: choice-of-anchor Q domain-containing protein [Anaerolineales bacterium]|nr:S-layer homology domain-containing protein [Anaerolineales bacterium]WKZ39998.1 MAG: choice-of-anchor Q domain-containing protein [Anaerolineales bacterium]
MKPVLEKIIYAYICVSVMLTLTGTQPVYAASFTAATAAELIAAINTSNSNGQDDTITLTNDIVLTEENVDFGGGNGLPLVAADGGKSLTIDGAGYSISRSSVGGTPVFRLLYITAGAVVTLQNLTFSNGSNGSPGGAILNAGTLTIKNSSFISNTAGSGGAIHNYLNAVLNIQDSVFTGNSTTSLSGGAIYSTGNSVIINGSTFTGNTTAQNGGAISMIGGDTLSITNSTFVNNTAATFGGGIYNFGNYGVEIINTTFFNNAAGDGGSVYNESGSVTLRNSLLAVDIFLMVNCGGSIIAGVDNIATDTTCASSMPVSFNQLKLGTLGNYSGSTQTIPLLAGSPAIDHVSVDGAYCPATDQRGVTRPQGSACDVGAYEKLGSPYPTFADVPVDSFGWAHIESIYAAGITGGCTTSPLNYCPGNPVTRAQMAIFLLRGIHGSGYAPAAPAGDVFSDVPSTAFAAAWIEQLFAEGITGGCGGGNYCPNNPVTRAQMAIFLLRAKYGSDYTPPPPTGILFDDIPANAFAAAWIEQLAAEGITSGCGGGNYCPNNTVTRAQMAVFIQKTFALPLP